MQSVIEVLQKSEAFLAKSGVETPKIDAEWLLSDCMGIPRLELFLQHDKPLPEEVLAEMRKRIKRRASGEPLQYILGQVDFHEVRLSVAPGVLIPRPETELLVEKVLQRLKDKQAQRIIDLGTGSGAIALALAKALPEAKVLAVEKSPDALQLARANAEALELRDRVAFRSGNWLEGLDLEADCIVSNPPYLTDQEWAEARREVREHEPREALVAADKGLTDLRQIIDAAVNCLAPGGLLALEMGIGHGEALAGYAGAAGYRDCVVEKDDTGRDRFLFAWKPK
ncbi:MAG: peptide chain release factor N(5)-glutamine methyltransferase [Puniceicoccaceae bacterium]